MLRKFWLRSPLSLNGFYTPQLWSTQLLCSSWGSSRNQELMPLVWAAHSLVPSRHGWQAWPSLSSSRLPTLFSFARCGVRSAKPVVICCSRRLMCTLFEEPTMRTDFKEPPIRDVRVVGMRTKRNSMSNTKDLIHTGWGGIGSKRSRHLEKHRTCSPAMKTKNSITRVQITMTLPLI